MSEWMPNIVFVLSLPTHFELYMCVLAVGRVGKGHRTNIYHCRRVTNHQAKVGNICRIISVYSHEWYFWFIWDLYLGFME